MSAVDPYPRHYSYPLVTWGSTLLGAVVALITSAMLNLLGAALGVAAVTIGQSTQAAASVGIVGLAWVVIANLIALGFGAWVAGRSTANPDHHGGTLQGVAVWAITSCAVLILAGSALGGGGAFMQSAGFGSGGAPAGAAEQSATSNGPAGADQAAQDAQSTIQQNAPAIRKTATEAAGAAAAAAFGGFLAMALGLVAAIVGARMGTRHPNWADRPRFTYVERRH